MLELSTRTPTADEQRYIASQCKPDYASLGCMALTIGIFPGILLGLAGGWIGGLISPQVAGWARYIGWGIGALLLLFGTYWYWPTERMRRRQADADFTEAVVEILTVTSSRVVELFCPGSHEPCLIFDLGGNQVLYLHGQWLRWESTYGAPDIVDDGNDKYLNLLDPPYSFPSNAFTVTRLRNSGHVFGIKVSGDYLSLDDPVDALKREFDFNDCEIIPGTIDSIADSLQAEHERRRGT